MEWDEYKKKFELEANKHNKSDEYCEKWLAYAKKIFDNNIPIIFSQEHFCLLVGYSPEYVYSASNLPRRHYRTFYIPKKSGGNREISEPLPNLKDIQKWILDNILYKVSISPYAKAYVKNRNIRENARFHRGQVKVMTLDIHDFFGSISSFWIYELFNWLGYSKDVSMMLTSLCCLEGSIPQGAPTSAALSNIIMKRFDDAVATYCKKKGIRYTRYADDMTFSGDFDEKELLRFVRKELKKYRFNLNNNKTRVRKQGQQQEVTGIIVNQKLQLPKKRRKEIRQDLYYIKKYGLQSHLNKIGEERQNYLQHLFGVVCYGLFVNPKDVELKEYKAFLQGLMNMQEDFI